MMSAEGFCDCRMSVGRSFVFDVCSFALAVAYIDNKRILGRILYTIILNYVKVVVKYQSSPIIIIIIIIIILNYVDIILDMF